MEFCCRLKVTEISGFQDIKCSISPIWKPRYNQWLHYVTKHPWSFRLPIILSQHWLHLKSCSPNSFKMAYSRACNFYHSMDQRQLRSCVPIGTKPGRNSMHQLFRIIFKSGRNNVNIKMFGFCQKRHDEWILGMQPKSTIFFSTWKTLALRGFLSGPMAKTLPSQCRGPRFKPWPRN